MKRFFKILAIVFFPFIHLLALSNEVDKVYFVNLSTDDGLSNSTVSDFVQDQDGFIWIGTQNGINRYDGISFKVYRINSRDSSELKSVYIEKLFIDSYGILWVGTNIGMGFYDREADRFINLDFHSDGLDVEAMIYDIEEDNKGDIYFVSSMGFFKYRRNLNTITRIDLEMFSGELDYKKLHDIEIYEPGKILCSYMNNLLLLDFEKDSYKVLTSIPAESDQLSQLNFGIYRITSDKYNRIWFGTYTGEVYLYSIKLDILQRIQFPKASIVYSIVPETDNTMLVSLDGAGLFRCNINTLKVTPVTNARATVTGIQNNKILTVFIDKQNILWLGHVQSGLSFTNLTPTGFKSIVYSEHEDNGLPFPIISCFENDKVGNLWVGTDGGGISIFDTAMSPTGSFSHNNSDKFSIPDNSVLSLFLDSDSIMWIGSYRGGLTYFNDKSKKFHSYQFHPNNPNSIPSNDIRKITEDDNKNLWLITHSAGIGSFDKHSKEFTNFAVNNKDGKSISSNWTFDLEIDHNKDIWATSSYGLSRFNKESQRFSQFFAEQNQPLSLLNNLVLCVHHDGLNRMWIGTNSGLNQYDYNSKKMIAHTSDVGLPEITINSITSDDQGDIWLGTVNGLYRYSPLTQKVKHFTVEDGLQGNEFILNAAFKDIKGKLYFGGSKGFSYFHPNKLSFNTTPPQVKITEIEVNKQKRKTGLTKNYIFPYDSNFVSFEFSVLNFINPSKNKCKYKLIGIDDDWINTEAEFKAKYTSLPPGDYTFTVIGANNEGIWNMKGDSFHFTIMKPWWSAWWFRILMLITTITLTSLFYLLRIRAVNRTNIKLERIVKARTYELTVSNKNLENRNLEVIKQNQVLKDKQTEINQQQEKLILINSQLYSHKKILTEKNTELKTLINTKDKMMSIIAHDLKNPMNTVIGFSSLLSKNTHKYTAEKIERFAGLINNSSIHTHKLLENLLLWARSQTGAIKLNIVNNDINEIITETITLLKDTANNKAITIKYSPIHSNYAQVQIDSNTISTVIRNLISNAVKFTPRNGVIIIAAQKKDNVLLISISDSGVGMTKEQQQKIFTINQNNSTDGTEKETGTGLGLIICKEFVEMNNGTISFKSKEGQGTAFYINLPVFNCK